MTIVATFELAYPGFRLAFDASLPSRGVSVLFGPSGCGKTTVLRCMAGLTRPMLGRLVVDAEIWQDGATFLPTHRRPLGYVFQEASLFAHLDVRGNLAYGRARAAGSESKAALERVAALLGIDTLLNRMPGGLSGGERQRVAIARALLTEPRLLLMDEPLSALDVARKAEFLPYLERMHAELEIPVIYVSHDPDEVARIADYIVAMENGQVLAAGTLTDVLSRVDLPIRLGEDAGVVLDGIVAERDPTWHLVRVGFAGGSLWVRDSGHEIGRPVRVRVLARDVSLALTHGDASSIVNCLAATIERLADESHPALTLVRLRVGAASLVARITKRSAAALGLAPGMTVWAQIKAVAIVA